MELWHCIQDDENDSEGGEDHDEDDDDDDEDDDGDDDMSEPFSDSEGSSEDEDVEVCLNPEHGHHMLRPLKASSADSSFVDERCCHVNSACLLVACATHLQPSPHNEQGNSNGSCFLILIVVYGAW